MVVYQGDLYVAGDFDQAGSTTAYNIARWDGSTWKSVGNGTSGIIYSLKVDTLRNILYAGGGVTSADNKTAYRIAQWDGTSWNKVGDSTFFRRSAIFALEMYRGYLYAGSMGPQGLPTDTCFARWDGAQWEPIIGPNSNVSSLQTYKDELYLGGSFTKIGNDTIPYLARYYNPDSVVVGMYDKKKEEIKIKLYPNPTTNELIIESSIKIKYYSIIDAKGLELKKGKLLLNKISLEEFESGMYFILLKDDDENFISIQKIIKE